jgi:hypothetical protein
MSEFIPDGMTAYVGPHEPTLVADFDYAEIDRRLGGAHG